MSYKFYYATQLSAFLILHRKSPRVKFISSASVLQGEAQVE